MKRMLFAVVISLAAPGGAWAQRVTPVPPVPPAPPAPMTAPAPPSPPQAPAPAVPVAPRLAPRPAPPPPPPVRLKDLNDDLHEFTFEFGSDARLEPLRGKIEDARAMAKLTGDLSALEFRERDLVEPFLFTQGGVVVGTRSSDGDYQAGMSRMQQRQYERAIESFNRVIAAKSDRADAALYWKAYVEYKLAQHDAALTSLAALRRDHPASRYLADAKVLEADVKRTAGRPAAPGAVDDDEIKLLAIQGLSKTGEAVPLLENVLTASNSLGVKRRALYVLALSNDPKANEVLMRYAKGSGNPDLQVEAIRYLGERATALNADQLRQIFVDVDDLRVKLAIIDAYRARSDRSALIKLAADRQLTSDVRPQVLSRLSGLVTADDVMGLYRGETDPAVRVVIVSNLGNTLNAEQLAQIARTDAELRVRQRAISMLGSKRTDEHAKALVGVYQAQSDRDTRRTVIGMLSGQRNAEALVALARQESDLELKRDLVRHLSDMASSSKAAADFLMEQLR